MIYLESMSLAVALEEGLQFAPMGLAIGGANIFVAN